MNAGQLILPGSQYRVLFVPELESLPLATLEKMIGLAEAGATIIFQNKTWDVPGLADHEERKAELDNLLNSLSFNEIDGIKVADVGNGRIIVEKEAAKALQWLDVRGEEIADSGLKFMRMKQENGKIYFLVNHSNTTIDQELRLNSKGQSAVIMDPVSGKIGNLPIKLTDSGMSLRVQIKPGESLILKTLDGRSTNNSWEFAKEGEPLKVQGNWEVSALAGGPELPPSFTTSNLVSWTENAGGWEYFSGTARYSIEVELSEINANDYLLKFDQLGESAMVRVNGDSVGTIWSVPKELKIGSHLKAGTNELVIEVSNLMANRIRYMDLNKIEWRKFHEINFVNIDYKQFDAAVWEPMPSGIIGGVYIVPLIQK